MYDIEKSIRHWYFNSEKKYWSEKLTPIISGHGWPSVVLLDPRSTYGLQTLFRQQNTQNNLLLDCPDGRNERSHFLGNKMPEGDAMYM